MRNIPFLPIDVIAWLSSGTITTMSNAEEGIYIRLLIHSWNYPNCILPNDMQEVRKLAKNAPEKQVRRVLVKCFSFVENGWRNEKIFEKFLETINKSQQASYAAKCRINKERARADAELALIGSSAERPADFQQTKTETKTELKKEPKTFLRRTKISFNADTRRLENISPEFAAMLKEKFPGVDYDQKIRDLEAWLFSNPSRRKSNYERFLTNVFSKDQDKPRQSGGNVDGAGSKNFGARNSGNQNGGIRAAPGEYDGIKPFMVIGDSD